jgi:5-methylcytosine-specific restriction endonuclease McrA
LCSRCYAKDRNDRQPLAACHPEKAVFSQGLCKACYASRWRERRGKTAGGRGVPLRSLRVCPVDGTKFRANTGSTYCSWECKRRAGRPVRFCLDCAGPVSPWAKRCLECRIHRANHKSEWRYVSDRRAVFDRDGWVCHLCRKKVPKDKAFPHPLSATVDHLVPVSAGGSNTLDNLQTAHFGCNRKRRTGGVVQLRLIA